MNRHIIPLIIISTLMMCSSGYSFANTIVANLRVVLSNGAKVTHCQLMLFTTMYHLRLLFN